MARSKPAAKIAAKNPTTEPKQKIEKSKKSAKKPAKAALDIAQKLAESETVKAVAVVEKKAPAAQVSQSPYQLDKAQILKAARALLKHISTSSAVAAEKPDLLSDPSDPTDSAIPLWLVLTTKKYITETKKLKPTSIRLPFPLLNPTTTTVCLIVKDPQRHYKDLVSASSLQNIVTKVVGIGKLKKKYKAFEIRRQLLDGHDVFLADDRVATLLPAALGSTFYRKPAKIPVPIVLSGNDTPGGLQKVVEKALQSTFVNLSPAATTSIRVALSSFSPEQVVENVAKVVADMTEKKIPGGFKNVKSIHIKSPTSASLPIYMAGEVYGDEDVLKPEEEKERLLAVAKHAAERKERKEKKIAKRKGLSESKSTKEVEYKAEEKEADTPKKKKAKVTAEEK